VAFLAAFGLVTIGRWLRTAEYRAWAWGWLALGVGTIALCLASLLSEVGEQPFLLIHTLAVATFCIFTALGTSLVLKVEDVRQHRIRTTHTSIIVFLTIVTGLLILWRWPLAERHAIWEEHYLWSGPWLIGYALFCIWMITRNQNRWYLRKSNQLLVYSIGLLGVIEATILGILIAYDPKVPANAQEALSWLMLAEPILLLMVALAMHTLVMDGLVHHLERTLVKVSKNSAKLKVMAERDPLTAVLNRHAFYSLVGNKRDEAKKPLGGSVAVIDIDNLKPLNDNYGHVAGDAAIRAVAKAIRSVIRAEDLLFRWGGDEFMVILPHVNLEESRWRFQKLDDVLQKTPLPGVPQPTNITLSIGVSPFSSNNSLEKAIEEADERMYARKMEKKSQLEPAASR
jgi:diguanylate cyclase (GGDEF)-like protein